MKQLFSLLFIVVPCLQYGQTGLSDEKIEDLIEQADIAGMSLAIIRNGEVADIKAFGVKSYYEMDPVTDKTVFAAASLSKPVFAYALLQLIDEGKFDLDKPLYTYMSYPDIEHDNRYKKVTARMILSHQSGLPNWRQGELEFELEPGTGFQYSGEGFVWLMKVIEKLTGSDIDQFVRQRIFEPLGMESSGYVWNDRFETDYAIPHDEDLIPSSKYKPEEGNAAHSLQTTAEDFAKFLLAVLNGKFLKTETADEIFEVQNSVPKRSGTPGVLHESVFWGLGFGLQKTGSGTSVWHWGDNGTFKCFFILNRDSGSGLVYFTNSSNGLSITPRLIENTLGEEVPAWDWINYETYDSPANLIYKRWQSHSLEETLEPFLSADGKHQDTSLIDENAMNRLGYRLMIARKMEEAKVIFKMNILAYPQSYNVYDSYAEACIKMGFVEEAISHYKKSLEINPENKNGEWILAQLNRSFFPENQYMFELRAYRHARYVSVIGDFNNWDDLRTICRLENNRWVGFAKLEPGMHEYKFLVDGVSILDPLNPQNKYDNGWHRSIVTVPEKN